MNGIHLTFDAAGIGKCFYTEQLDLQTIGSLEIHRASSVEFNADLQVWEVIQGTKILFSHASRDQCLAWEQQHFNSTEYETKNH
jgi:hypothetical protein